MNRGDTNYTISAEGTYKSVEDVKGTVVTYKANSAGEMVPVLLRDVANVYSGYKDVTSEAYMGGKSCVMLMIQMIKVSFRSLMMHCTVYQFESL